MRVLFVSKAIVPPFHDGTKCLVRDIAQNLTRVEPVVLSSKGAAASLFGDASSSRVSSVPVYSGAGSFTPALAQNMRAAAWILLRSRADVWHFVFAPNRNSSQAGRWLSRVRKVPVVQTIASPPRSFTDVDGLLFGDIVVAQSRWTRDQVIASYAAKGLKAPELRVIAPPVPLDLARSREQTASVRAELRIAPEAPLFVYPGDLETSRGAQVTAELAARIGAKVPGAVVVFAYRNKSKDSQPIAEALRAGLNAESTRFVASLPDILSLIGSATAVLFPVDDLWGKVDLPIVLLEAMVLGVPVLSYDGGPLADLEGVMSLSTLDADAWLEGAAKLALDAAARSACIERQSSWVRANHGAARIAAAYEELYLELGTRSGNHSQA